jgi:mRNA-degrading endonuclease RelE of RelBE toxin-antitoxin system
LCEHGVVQIAWHREPLKVLRRLQPAKAADIVEAIERIAADPSAPNNNVRPLRGVRHGFQVRVGDWRVSYSLDHVADLLTVVEVAPRGGAYR